METRAQHILIGLFTLLGTGTLLLFILWMSRTGVEGEARHYDILFHEAVSGLSVGSPVSYSGIRVGEVIDLWLDEDDPRQVWARVRISTRVPIKTDTTARLSLLNITGASGIELSQGLPESPTLTARGIPVIEAEPSSFARLQLSGGELVENITRLVRRANAVLSAENLEHFNQVLTNINTVTTIVAEQQEDLRIGLQALADSGTQLSAMLERLEQGLAVKGEQFVREATETLSHVRDLSQQLDTLLSENSAALAQGMQGAGELGPAVQDLRTLLNQLNSLARQLEAGPAGTVLGQDDLKEFTP